MRFLATPFSGGQLSLIIIIASVIAFLFVANAILIFVLHYKRKKKKLCTEQLQQQREQLLEELKTLGKTASAAPVAEKIPEPEPLPLAEEPVSESAAALAQVLEEEEQEFAAEGGVFRAEILAVANMTDEMRERFGFTAEEYLAKRYYVRTAYSFEAKLVNSDKKVKGHYAKFSNEVLRYKKLTTRRSFRLERIYSGRKTIALVLFRGKTLCIAFALNPADFADTKYRGIDMSETKRFANTPMLLKLTSSRRLEYAKHLLGLAAENAGLTAEEGEFTAKYALAPKSKGQLFAEDKIKIKILGEAPQVDYDEDENDLVFRGRKILAVADMSDLMRERFGLTAPEFDSKKYYVQFGFSFGARLRGANEEVKARYTEFTDEATKYSKLALYGSFRQQRLRAGRKTVALILFKGKTLCVAFALDPTDYEDTKYRGEDLSEVKRFANTPMLLRITSARRLNYAKYLLGVAAEKAGLTAGEEVKGTYDMQPLDINGLFAENLLKIKVLGLAEEE